METKLIDVKKENVPLQKLLEFVASGLDVVLTEGKSPVARLVPVPHKAKTPRVPGLSAGKIWISPDFDDPLPDEFFLWRNNEPDKLCNVHVLGRINQVCL